MPRLRAFCVLVGYLLGVSALLSIYFAGFHYTEPPVVTVREDLQEKVDSLQQRVGHAEILMQKQWRNLLQSESRMSDASELTLQLPSIFDYLPYLRNATHLEPALRVAGPKPRTNVRIVLGIPSVKRDIQSYLTSTVENLIANMNMYERNSTLIVIMLADLNSTIVESEVHEIRTILEDHIRSGLVEIINPPRHFYPDLDNLTPTLGDSKDRMKWRTKQSYDFAYLMMYASSRGEFYVQLEDDILSKPGFISNMLAFTQKQLASPRKNFFVLDFCSLGFIGKLFKCVDLIKFCTYILTFASDQPVDWILDHYVQTKVCRFDKDAKHCRKMKSTIWITHKPSLFQHVGTHSSLKGKTQALKDHQYGKVNLFIPHRDNVPAEVESSMKNYKTYTIQRAYMGDSLFWGLLPSAGDHITITFHEPVMLEKVLFRSGDVEHPNDRFSNASIEAMAAPSPRDNQLANDVDTNRSARTVKEWREITRFDQHGLAATGPIGFPVEAIRLVVLADHDHWGILSEIQVKGSAVQMDASLL